ncbi:MAG: Hsp20/alpha crystallin family protein [Cyanobacteria bacterium J06638_28]
MIVRYRSPFQDVDAIRRQFDHIFDDLAPVAKTWTPSVTLKDRGNELELKVQLPGVTANAIDIQASREAVAIAGEYHPADAQEGEKVLYNEIRYGSFRRVVNLPIEVEHEAIAADYTDGILTLTLPKVVAERNKVVKVALNPEVTDVATSAEHAAQ